MFKPQLSSQPASPPFFELFHENTKYSRAHYAEHAQKFSAQLRSRSAVQAMSHNFKVYRFAPKIPLPEPQACQVGLHQALRDRVSSRVFSGTALSLDAVASVLIPAAACNRVAALTDFPPLELHLRSYPSGGGEFPIEIYAVLLRVQGVETCITHFDPRAKALSVLHTGHTIRELPSCLMNSEGIVQTAAVFIVLTALFERSTVKYGDRGYRLVLLEAGHVAQNLCLTAAARGLGTLAWGGFFDDELNRFLGIDGVNEAAVHSLFIGGRAQ